MTKRIVTTSKMEYLGPGEWPANRGTTVCVVSPGKAMTMPATEFVEVVARIVEPSAMAALNVFDETIGGLVEVREFLGLQLDHAWGNISDEDFERRAEPFLAAQESGDPTTLQAKIAILRTLPKVNLDGETLSAVFRCPSSEVEAALAAVSGEKRKLSAHG